jgi:uncharacterized membrane protein YsdA (DUF1294 family)
MRETAHKPYVFYGVLTGGIALVASCLAWSQMNASLWISACIGINIAAIVVMGIDKSFARANTTRAPEVLLYVIALVGGSPGILAGIHIFKHKTRKAAFQFTLLIIFALQLALVRMLGLTPR